jgi:hypothetical protein
MTEPALNVHTAIAAMKTAAGLIVAAYRSGNAGKWAAIEEAVGAGGRLRIVIDTDSSDSSLVVSGWLVTPGQAVYQVFEESELAAH